jgi:hypothetical protein
MLNSIVAKKMGNPRTDKCDISCNRRKRHTNMSFYKVYAVYVTVKSFLYVHSIGKCKEDTILNLELMLFHLKSMVSKENLSITACGEGERYEHRCLVTFYYFGRH